MSMAVWNLLSIWREIGKCRGWPANIEWRAFSTISRGINFKLLTNPFWHLKIVLAYNGANKFQTRFEALHVSLGGGANDELLRGVGDRWTRRSWWTILQAPDVFVHVRNGSDVPYYGNMSFREERPRPGNCSSNSYLSAPQLDYHSKPVITHIDLEYVRIEPGYKPENAYKHEITETQPDACVFTAELVESVN